MIYIFQLFFDANKPKSGQQLVIKESTYLLSYH